MEYNDKYVYITVISAIVGIISDGIISVICVFISIGSLIAQIIDYKRLKEKNKQLERGIKE